MFNEVKISAHYQLTVADYLEAQQLYNQKSKVFFANFYLLPLLTFFLLVEIYRLKDPSFLVFFPSSYEYTNDELWTNIFVFSIIDWLSISTRFPTFDPISWWFTSKRYQKNFVQQESKQITISATGVNITSQNYRESRAWENIDRVLENKKIFLLCNSRSEERTIIPKRIFESEAAIKDFQDLLTKVKS
ncbi:MAG: YcxB family protein [Waterburya sp.]